MQQGLRCQEPFPAQGPDQNKIRSIYLIPDCSKPISAVIYSASGSLVLHWFCFFAAGPVDLLSRVCLAPCVVWLDYNSDQRHHQSIWNNPNHPVMFPRRQGQEWITALFVSLMALKKWNRVLMIIGQCHSKKSMWFAKQSERQVSSDVSVKS